MIIESSDLRPPRSPSVSLRSQPKVVCVNVFFQGRRTGKSIVISVVKWTVLMSVMDIFLKMVLNWMVVVWVVLMKMVSMAWS